MKTLASSLLLVALLLGAALAHPLGNFTINHFVRVESGAARVLVRYVVDLAEIPTVQEAQTTIDADSDGTMSQAELDAYLKRIAPGYVDGLLLTADGARVPLAITTQRIERLDGAAGLSTLRLVFDLGGAFAANSTAPRFRCENRNQRERAGWREMVVVPLAGATVYDSTAYGNGVTDELKAYPEDLVMAPLDERTAEWSATSGAMPAGAKALTQRDGKPVAAARDRFADLIAVKELTLGGALLGLLIAFALGGLHALSPGHGKTIVGAYLVGARGTMKHAAFLGLTVTITHTIGVFALGLVTLFASQYILPEKLYPVLSFVSGALVVLIGASLFRRRLNSALSIHDHDHGHQHETAFGGHAHGEHAHSHLPPGADGEPLTWRSLLAIGVSGGLLPCPSALVVLLAAISLHRVGYGMLLITTFSLGLASVLTAVGLAFLYAGRWLKVSKRAGVAMRVLPAGSALVITIAGLVICWQALAAAGASPDFSAARNSAAATALGLGLVLGLRHALDADHLAAMAAIVGERRGLLGSSLIGGLWGVGHTVSLLLAGAVVILLGIEIGERTALALEFGVALMLISLGINALFKLWRGERLHLHIHEHGGREHVHPHLHGDQPEPQPHTHHGLRLGWRPLLIGMVHGLAGSAALMLIVLTTIPTPFLRFVYIAVFGLGSIGGMMAMSSLLSLPMQLTAQRFARTHLAVRTLAALFSLGFGLFMSYEIGFAEGLFR